MSIPTNIDGCNELFCTNCNYSQDRTYNFPRFTGRDNCKRRKEFLNQALGLLLPRPEIIIVIEHSTVSCVVAKHEPFIYRIIDLDSKGAAKDLEADTTDDLELYTKKILEG